MHIAMVAPAEERVPPHKYGGTELVVYNLVEQLISLGHKVTLFASGDSITSAELIPTSSQAIRSIPEASDLEVRSRYKQESIQKALQKINNISADIIHNHITPEFLPFQSQCDVPVVSTIHWILSQPETKETYRQYADSPLVSISYSQRKDFPTLNFIGNVYNGIRVEDYTFNPHPSDYFSFIGRITPEKGPLEAIKIAKQAGVKLVIAAKVDTGNKEYFDKQIAPLIDGDQIKFIGEVDHAGKVALLSQSRGLIIPLQWEEPFGLCFTEAMACGAPVITFKRGSTPELIIEGKTGYICQDIAEAVARIADIDKIDRYECRKHVENNFSAKQMAEGYLACYEQAIKNKQAQTQLKFA